MTLHELRERMKYWQDRLNLREWKLTLQWMPARQAREFQGLCAWSVEELTAVVQIRRAQEDVEATLVHELLHIVLQGHKEYEDYDLALERAINRITEALMAGDE